MPGDYEAEARALGWNQRDGKIFLNVPAPNESLPITFYVDTWQEAVEKSRELRDVNKLPRS